MTAAVRKLPNPGSASAGAAWNSGGPRDEHRQREDRQSVTRNCLYGFARFCSDAGGVNQNSRPVLIST